MVRAGRAATMKPYRIEVLKRSMKLCLLFDQAAGLFVRHHHVR